ncbi:4-hydroxybenzoyl-CoA reductase subunit gamma [bacterium BMS3Abin02]|nr:4-hydroxybenzoyl-CoA reductase subunit gamma [bacterium BMS3Abin02]GBE20785.1 4-hydroxybenzoyl-CoA reductase subunit gamma [bacterium BMS3Bbin01]HDH25091.1 (2Fe-2S)-binding protein [Actinomycetota bacterium]
MRFTVNDQSFDEQVPAGESLLVLLRRLGFKGVKNGCDNGDCGACAVLVDGRAITSCNYPAPAAEGTRVLTVEGLAPEGMLHPLQTAFLDTGAVQCGFCIPGMLMSAIALLDREPDPSEADVRAALRGNLCRCTGYVKPIEAVQLAAARLREVTDG